MPTGNYGLPAPAKKVEASAGPAINESTQGAGQFSANSLPEIPGQAPKADVRVVTESGGKMAAVEFKDCTMGEPPVVVKARAKPKVTKSYTIPLSYPRRRRQGGPPAAQANVSYKDTAITPISNLTANANPMRIQVWPTARSISRPSANSKA